MLTILTIPDLIKFLMSQCAWFIMALWRSRHSTLMILVTTCLVTMALTIFLTYRCVQISKLRNPYIVDDLSYQSKDLYNQLSNSNTRLTLLGQMPPITVHYMWCRKSHFEYKHYLSLLSVAKVLLPDQIVFHYLEMPQTDRKGYFTWFDDIQREVAMLSLKQIHNTRHCSHDFSKGVPKSDDFPSADGVFMMEDIAITNLSRDAFYQHTGAKKLARSVCEDQDGQVCENVDRKPAQLFLLPASEPYSLVPGQGRAIFECPTIDAFNKANISTCLQLSQRLFPSDLWQRNKTFERFARRIAFNNPEAVSPVPNPALSAPSIAHILKFDGEEGLSPLCYASIRSAFTQGKLQHVFVHGVLEKEKDSLWNTLVGKFSVTHVPTPSMDASSSTRQQLLYGMHVLIQYGGILLTCDTIVQKPVDPLLHYPSVSTVQKSIYRIIHHHIDFRVLVARPASEYLQSLIPVLKQMIETDSERDIGAVAYHVLEQYPSSVHLDSNLVGHLTCKAKRCLPKEGQLDVRQAYAVTISWTEGGPPTSLQELEQLSTPLVSLT
ncbi:uncharacterized protein [Littorina saxatilis]|uniref:uncharacterized protein n=1 Tax=Littorina saxatilis TaxID=31220 RepID=UPI0038B59B73